MRTNIITEMTTKNNFCLIYALYPKAYLEKIKHHVNYLLKKKWVACVNILPSVNSIYLWKENGKEEICEEEELIIFFKTMKNREEKVKNYLVDNHSYNTPCVITLSSEANKEYLDYLEQYLNK